MLNNIGLPGILLIAVVVLVLFGRGKISGLMGEVGKGITSFKKGINEGSKEIEDEDAAIAAKDVTPEGEKDKDGCGRALMKGALRSIFPDVDEGGQGPAGLADGGRNAGDEADHADQQQRRGLAQGMGHGDDGTGHDARHGERQGMLEYGLGL